MTRSIYGLVASDEPELIRYVGITTQTLEQRLRGHWYDERRRFWRKDHRKSDWMKSVQDRGATVQIVLLGQAADDCALFEMEKELMSKHNLTGQLLNLDFIRRSGGKRKIASHA